VFVGILVGVAGPVIEAGRYQHIGIDDEIALAAGWQCAKQHLHRLAPGRAKGAYAHRVCQSGQNRWKAGQQHPGVAALGQQGGRQGAGNVGQTAGFQEGKDFGTDLQYAHGGSRVSG